MTAPPITFNPTAPTEVKFFDNFSVYLYANKDIFDAYYAWATPVGTAATTYERNAAQLHSGYVLRFKCNISSATPSGAVQNFNGSGCCLQDASGQGGGGYCLL